MAGDFAAPDAAQLAKLRRSVGAAHPPHGDSRSQRLQIFGNGLGTADVFQDDALLPFFLDEILAQQRDDQVGRNETARLVDEHHAVGITVVDDADITFVRDDQFLQVNHIFGLEGIGLVVRETAVEGIVEITGLFTENAVYEDRRHAVGAVHADGKVGEILLETVEEFHILIADVVIADSPPLCSHGCGTALEDPLLDGAQTRVVADGERQLPGDLQAVVVFRVMGGRDLDGGLETVPGRHVIDKRCRAEAQVADLGVSGRYRNGRGCRRHGRLSASW